MGHSMSFGRHLLPALLILAVLVPLGPSAALEPPPLPPVPTLNDAGYTFTYEANGTRVTIVLANDTTLLGHTPPTAQPVVLLQPRTLYIKTCYPCEEVTAPIYSPLYPEHCFVGTEPRHEQRVCIFNREGGLTTELGEVNDESLALFVWGDGCVIHEREGLPPQKAAVEGLALPAAQLVPGGSCDA